MALPTFGDVWRAIRVNVPGAPVTLVRRWVMHAYRQLADSRQWSWMLLEGQLVWQDARVLTSVTTTFGSTNVTGPAATFVAGDAGRQFRVGTYPIYTVSAYNNDTSITLDRNYEGLTAGVGAAQILDAYATLPENFENFLMIVDPVNQRMVPWWATWSEMDLIDPIRSSSASTPRLLAARKLSGVAATLGQAQYEYYPKPTARGALQYYAKALPRALNENDPLPGFLSARVDVLETGALAQAARWPGTESSKNPYFNLALAKQLSDDFRALTVQMDLRDDDLYQQSIDNLPWQKWNLWSWAYDTHLLQASDATLASYAGYGATSVW